MMGVSLAEVVWVGFPVAVSLLPIVVGDAIRDRGIRAQLLATAGFALLGLALGAFLYLYPRRMQGVPDSQALAGAALAAGLLVALPAAAYLQLGYRARLLWLAIGVWVASLIPLLIYLFVAALVVYKKFECAPGVDCSPFS